MNIARKTSDALVRVLSSQGLACILLMVLGLLTWLGTLEQVNTGLFEVQKKYFESYFLIHQAGPVPIPLPGANLVLCVLAVNLIVGGLIRLRRDWSKLGILITHVGILMLIGAAAIKMYNSTDGHVTLYEGESADHFQSYYRWELAIMRDAGNGTYEEFVVPQEAFLAATGAQPVLLTSSVLPFDLEVRHVMPNARVLPKGPMFDVDVPVIEGVFLQANERLPQAEANTAGAYVTVVSEDDREEGIVWGRERAPWTVDVEGSRYAIGLRNERYPMPFSLRLDKFTKEDHPRLNMPRTFESDVTVTEAGGPRNVKISMNEPLRDEGLVLYQSSWGPSDAGPGAPLFSTLSVVRNPADQYPLYSCIVISIGLVLHFSRKLTKYIRAEARR